MIPCQARLCHATYFMNTRVMHAGFDGPADSPLALSLLGNLFTAMDFSAIDLAF